MLSATDATSKVIGFWFRDSGRSMGPVTIRSSMIGTATKKTDPHQSRLKRSPPTIGPSAPPAARLKDHTPPPDPAEAASTHKWPQCASSFQTEGPHRNGTAALTGLWKHCADQGKG